jgi:hypothetical protein
MGGAHSGHVGMVGEAGLVHSQCTGSTSTVCGTSIHLALVSPAECRPSQRTFLVPISVYMLNDCLTHLINVPRDTK